MKTLPTILTTMTLVAGLSLAPALIRAPAYAVDNMSSTDAPDLTSVRAKIKAKDYAAALAELRDLAEDTQQADVYNLLGFTLRKTGDFKTSLTYYTKALELQPDHKAAREYLGELYVETGNHGEGQGTARHPRETLPRRLRRARGPAEGNQRQISEQVKARATDERSGRPLARFYFPAREPIGAIDGQGARDAKPYG